MARLRLAGTAALLAVAPAGGATYKYSMRDTVRIGHRANVQLPKDSAGEQRSVEVVTLSDDSTGPRAFLVDGVLSAEECRAIRAAARPGELAPSKLQQDFPLLKALRSGKEPRLRSLFRQADSDGDGRLSPGEFAYVLREHAGIVDYDHGEVLGAIPAAQRPASGASLAGSWTRLWRGGGQPPGAEAGEADLQVKDFLVVNWTAYLEALPPRRFGRHSSQAFIEYSRHPVLRGVLAKVAAITGLPPRLVRAKAEPLQLLLYEPEGAHYSCHIDESPNEVEDFRFLTVFFYLSDVGGAAGGGGGETVLFGADLNGSHPERRSWGDEEWRELKGQCQPTSSCPRHPSGDTTRPFESAVVVKPVKGRAVFWYNVKVDAQGRKTEFVWPSIHGGCPTRSEEKWAANVWLHGTGVAARPPASAEL